MGAKNSLAVKFNNFVNSNKSTPRFLEYIAANYNEMETLFCKYHPFIQSELTNVRKMIEHAIQPSVEKIANMINNVRSDSPAKRESFEYYNILFDENTAKEITKRKSSRCLGSNNIGYKHNGKLSKWSKNFIHGHENYEESLQDLKNKSSKTKQDNPENVNTRPEYYMKRLGVSYDDALHLLKARQRTFSLDTCIDKHGEIEGFKIWLNRQICYLETINNKHVDEMSEINFKKLPTSNAAYSQLEIDVADTLRNAGLPIEVQKPLKDIFNETKWKQYDICLGNKLIEVNGDYWHGNPKKYSANDLIMGEPASVVWEYDRLKTESAEQQGFEVFVIW